MTLSTLLYVCSIFSVLFIGGTLLCLKLYRWDYSRFFHSRLWVKVYYWIPIFISFLVILYVHWAAIVAVLLVATFALREYWRYAKFDRWAALYTIGICVAMSCLMFFMRLPLAAHAMAALLLVGFSSVLSDVFAYFCGNFFGRHRLPIWINANKSWEGVVGQLIGAVVGFVIIAPALHPLPSLMLAGIIGVASALGDITNSVVKRHIGIKEWGDTIPGHGGVLDRFASLSLAIAATYWWITLTAN